MIAMQKGEDLSFNKVSPAHFTMEHYKLYQSILDDGIKKMFYDYACVEGIGILSAEYCRNKYSIKAEV